MQTNEKILRLRSEASEKQWGKCTEVLGELLRELNNDDIIKFIQAHINRFLLICQSTYPFDSDFNEAIDVIQSTDSFQELKNQIAEIVTQIDGKCDPDYPGMNGFRSSLNEFNRLPSLSIEGILNIVSGIRTTILAHTWGTQNLELWTRWYRQETPQDKSILAKHFWSAVETQELNKANWDYTADKIQDMLMLD
jgi:hypothetical protein